MSGIGPELPPHLRHLSQRASSEGLDQEESEDDYTPSLPPDMIKTSSSTSQPSSSSSSARPPSEAYKPSAVPGPGPSNATIYDSDSDDDIGPKPLPSNAAAPTTVDPVAEFIAREERRKERIREEEEEKKKGPKREEWMLVPPSKDELLGKLDPSKLTKPRQFARTTPASSSNNNSSASSLWTETPAERQQRLADEVMGKKRPATQVSPSTEEKYLENKRRKMAEEDVRKGVEEHTRKVRGAALIDAHIEKEKAKKAGGGEEEKDLGIWDHGRDMALSGRLMDDSQRNKMIRDARSLGDRFGSGSSGGFL
ncbi:hypothetical protein GYMLUDRAFT_38316 [Collybiopsis luxurians FD-317 M1]|nr:hypothetical protein GYMLUDRAFT_38316 [Collybiopsis luxurians FD-317 M1]